MRLSFGQFSYFASSVVATALIFGRCSDRSLVKTAPFAENPVQYEYPFSLPVVRSAILSDLGKLPGYRYMSLEYRGKPVILKGEALLSREANRNDFYLHCSNATGRAIHYVWKSGDSIPYYASFHLHVVEENDHTTRVEVRTIDPLLGLGPGLLPMPPHFVRMERKKRVKPSTVEEYQILQRIGQGLGMLKEMPPLLRPAPY